MSCKELKIGACIPLHGKTFESQLVFASPAPSLIEIKDARPRLQHFIHHLPSDRLYDTLQEFRIFFKWFVDPTAPLSQFLGDSRCRLRLLTFDFVDYYCRFTILTTKSPKLIFADKSPKSP